MWIGFLKFSSQSWWVQDLPQNWWILGVSRRKWWKNVYMLCIFHGLFVHFRNKIWMCLKIIGKFAERNDRTSKFLAFLMSSFHTEDHHVCQTTMWFIDDHVSHYVTRSTFWMQGPRFCFPGLKVNSQKTVCLKRTYSLLDKHPAFMSFISLPGDSTWHVDSLLGGLLTFLRVTEASQKGHQKGHQKNCQPLAVKNLELYHPLIGI